MSEKNNQAPNHVQGFKNFFFLERWRGGGGGGLEEEFVSNGLSFKRLNELFTHLITTYLLVTQLIVICSLVT